MHREAFTCFHDNKTSLVATFAIGYLTPWTGCIIAELRSIRLIFCIPNYVEWIRTWQMENLKDCKIRTRLIKKYIFLVIYSIYNANLTWYCKLVDNLKCGHNFELICSPIVVNINYIEVAQRERGRGRGRRGKGKETP